MSSLIHPIAGGWSRRRVLGTAAASGAALALGAGFGSPARAQSGKLTYWGGLIFSEAANQLLSDTIMLVSSVPDVRLAVAITPGDGAWRPAVPPGALFLAVEGSDIGACLSYVIRHFFDSVDQFLAAKITNLDRFGCFVDVISQINCSTMQATGGYRRAIIEF